MNQPFTVERNLDETLRFLKKDHYSHHISFYEIQSLIENSVLHPYGLLPLLERLDKDGYVEKKYGKIDCSDYGIFKITLKGIQFIESGGYCQQLITDAKKEKRNKQIYWWSVIAGIASVIGALVAIFK